MKRSGFISRTKPLARTGRVKAKRSKPRRGPMRDKGYREWLRYSCKCLVCGHGTNALFTVDPAHTANNGGSSKGPDSSCIPLCRHHHDEMDGRLSTEITTKGAFAAKYGLDLEKEAASHYALYLLLEKGRLST